MSIQEHLKRFPQARPSTLALIEAKRAKTEQLKAELEAARRGQNVILLIAGKLKTLAERLVN